MIIDYSEEVKNLIKNYEGENIIFGKSLSFLLPRIKVSEEEIKNEILSCKNLYFCEKQIKNEEIRYALFFSYSRKKGRKYIITFRDTKLRIITTFPLGRRTIKRYRKKGLNI